MTYLQKKNIFFSLEIRRFGMRYLGNLNQLGT